MADNINVTAGSGKTIGADEISSVLYQRIKIVEGADGTNDGDVSATNPLPVELRDVDTTLVADVGAIKTSVQTIDDAIYTAGSGTPSKGTLALGSDGTNPRAIAVDTSGNLQVDIVSGGSSGTQYTEGDTDASITGTAALVEGAANALAVLTQPLTDTQLRASDVKITLDGESVPVTGTFWQATQPVSGTLAVTQSGTWDEVGINDSGNSITVDYATTGSGTATGALRVELPTNGTGVIATVGAVTAITNALPAGSNAIGKLAANSGVDIGDVDILSVIPGTGATNLGKAEDAAHSSGDTGVMSLGVRTDTPDTAKSGADGDYTPIATTSTGALRIAPISEDFAVLANGPQVKKYYTNAGAVTDGIVWSPAAGKRWYITDLIINVSAAATVTLEDDKAGGDEAVMKFELAANSGVSHSFNTPLFSGEDAADLIVTTSAGNVYITITGYEI